MKSKALSMKKLYNLAVPHVMEKHRVEESSDNHDKASQELDVINTYLRYVWEHRND